MSSPFFPLIKLARLHSNNWQMKGINETAFILFFILQVVIYFALQQLISQPDKPELSHLDAK